MGPRARAVVAVALIAVGLFQAVSGVLLFFGPKGPHTGKSLILGVEKEIWSTYHEYLGFVIIGLAVIHFLLNWRMFVRELQLLFRR